MIVTPLTNLFPTHVHGYLHVIFKVTPSPFQLCVCVLNAGTNFSCGLYLDITPMKFKTKIGWD